MISRVVFDTNTVVSSLLFSSGQLTWLRDAWRSERLIPVVSKRTISELLRVLAYPKFKLNSADREELLADYLPHAEIVGMPDELPDLPRCRDSSDQMFLLLAAVSNADALVTGDKDVLVLKDELPFAVLKPVELEQVVKRRM